MSGSSISDTDNQVNFDASIVKRIEQGEDPKEILHAINETAFMLGYARSTAIFLESEKIPGQFEIFSSRGPFQIPPDISNGLKHGIIGHVILDEVTPHKDVSGYFYCFNIVSHGVSIGMLVVASEEELTTRTKNKFKQLAYHASVVFQRFRFYGTLQHFLDRLQVLNELNQLNASNVELKRIHKSIVRESAFRFGADVSLIFLVDEDKKHLTIACGYGIASNDAPTKISASSGIIGQSLKIGTQISLSNLTNHDQNGLEFLESLGIKSVNVCCLQVRGETLGVMLIGFKNETIFNQNDVTRYEEFAQASAVAIANAQTQQRISDYNEKLEELVKTRTADLAIQTARAEEANHAKSQFLANMSHELRTPLTAIAGYSNIMAEGIFGDFTDEQMEAINAISQSSDHLKALIDDVLDLARIESGKDEAAPCDLPISGLLQEAHNLMIHSARGKDVTLHPISIGKEILDGAIFADKRHARQIIINLLSNAVKYTPPGGQVWISAEKLVDKIKISIRDTGVGIPSNKIDKLFERFERGEDDYSRSQQGTGIGLNLTKRLVNLNGGTIGAESVAGEGSTFWILLPSSISNARDVIENSIDSVMSVKLEGLTAVVVDDNSHTSEVLRHILSAAGVSVRTASNMKGCIALIDEKAPDILLTDLAMHGGGGVNLIHHIRSRHLPSMAKLPIIVLSACAFPSDQRDAMSAGASHFIAKPFKPIDILTSVRKLTLPTS